MAFLPSPSIWSSLSTVLVLTAALLAYKELEVNTHDDPICGLIFRNQGREIQERDNFYKDCSINNKARFLEKVMGIPFFGTKWNQKFN